MIQHSREKLPLRPICVGSFDFEGHDHERSATLWVFPHLKTWPGEFASFQLAKYNARLEDSKWIICSDFSKTHRKLDLG